MIFSSGSNVINQLTLSLYTFFADFSEKFQHCFASIFLKWEERDAV